MKNPNHFSASFLRISLGISLILLCGAALIFSLQTVQAKVNLPAGAMNFPSQMSQGRYQSHMFGFKNGNEYDFYVLKFDTETGAGDMYWYDRREGANVMSRWENADIPAGPVGQ